VKVEYVGRAPIAGSDDRKLEATLRDGNQPAHDKIMVASAGDFAPLRSRATVQRAPLRDVPAPPDRPYAGEEQVADASTEQPEPRFPAQRIQGFAMAAPAQDAPRLSSPVSAYAPVSYDAPAGFMNGRGLY